MPAVSKAQGGRVFQNCNVPLLVVVNTLLLVYIALHISSAVVSNHGSMMMVASPSPATPKESCGDMADALRKQVASLTKLRVAYGELFCEKHGIGPTGGYCVKSSDRQEGGNHHWDESVCARMADLFAGSTVLDLGCGLGWYGKCLQEADKDIRWTGYDGSEGIEKATEGYVKFADLAVPQYFEKRYDWVMSLEVGEHIPAEFEDVFVDNLVRHAEKGILLTWATEGQYGHHHVNNHNNDYIINKMRGRGFEYDAHVSEEMRKVATLEWFKHTIMVFWHKSSKTSAE